MILEIIYVKFFFSLASINIVPGPAWVLGTISPLIFFNDFPHLSLWVVSSHECSDHYFSDCSARFLCRSWGFHLFTVLSSPYLVLWTLAVRYSSTQGVHWFPPGFTLPVLQTWESQDNKVGAIIGLTLLFSISQGSLSLIVCLVSEKTLVSYSLCVLLFQARK